ncbi:MAG: response regulator [Candidatus Riflebacteria bacterium]|nr:response regulator [Candidatus Riflebacteria bacterium]
MAKKIILLVEDNPDDEMLTLRAFKKKKIEYDIIVAHDGAEALDFFSGKGIFEGRDVKQLPSIILLDLKLPKVDGLEVLKHLRANEATKLVPVIILTTSSEQQDILSSYNLGGNSFIRKPVDFDKFIYAVEQIGLYWLFLNEPPVSDSSTKG